MPLFLLGPFSSAKSIAGAAITFISKPPGSWIAAAIAACLGLWWVHHSGFKEGVKWQLARDADAAANINSQQPKIIERLKTVYLPQEAKIKTVTKTITERVPVYVTSENDSACPINNGFVRVHDSAAKGELPPRPSGDDGEPSGVKLSAVLGTLAENYGTANLCSVRLKLWQDWYLKNKALWDSNK